MSPYVYGLANVLVNDGVVVRVYANSDDAAFEDLFDPAVEIVRMPGRSIYEEWNDAARWAAQLDSDLMALNDDVVMLPGTAQVLAEALAAHPAYGVISVGEPQPVVEPSLLIPVSHQLGNRGGFHAWCFIARAEAWQDVDPGYRIWFGDDDLLWKVNAAGWSVGALLGVGVTHHVSTTSRHLPWVQQAAQEDSQLWARTRP